MRAAGLLALAMSMPAGVAHARTAQAPRQTSPETGAQSRGAVLGTAFKADDKPLPGARIRLRNASDGRQSETLRATAEGEFRFEGVVPGRYVCELLSARGTVLAVGDLFDVIPGQTSITSVRLSERDSLVGLFFASAAAAAIAAAASIGITATGSNGLPASPQ
ncbi:MAG TPA: carboxypeptidase-like regulatory domain-containing protein [Vicinamibacterales bacterium]|nr:carboxypeptidase-like regulatory domain-containing protein [Vicinamibacterales bacterium]